MVTFIRLTSLGTETTKIALNHTLIRLNCILFVFSPSDAKGKKKATHTEIQAQTH